MEGDIYPPLFKDKSETIRNVVNEAHNMYRSFLQQYGIVPNVIFLNQADADKLVPPNQSSFVSTRALPLQILGLNVLITELDRSYVALIPTE